MNGGRKGREEKMGERMIAGDRECLNSPGGWILVYDRLFGYLIGSFMHFDVSLNWFFLYLCSTEWTFSLINLLFKSPNAG